MIATKKARKSWHEKRGGLVELLMAYGKPSLVGRTVAFGTVFTLFVNSSALAIGAVVPDLRAAVED